MNCVIAALVVTPLAVGLPHQASSRDLTIASGDVTLAATLTLPAGSGRHPAAVLLAGSGPSTRQNLRRFSDHLNALGVATLVYDKRGSGQSTGSWTTASFDDAVADAQAAVATLQKHPRVDAARVGVWGVSQAGWFIPVLVDRTPSLAFAIVLTGGGSTPREVELFMHRAALDRAGISGAERADAERLLAGYFDWLGTGRGREQLVAAMAEARKTRWYPAISLDAVMPSDRNRPAWEWVATFDPLPYIERMRLPTLVLLGSADQMGSTAAARERWLAGFARAANDRGRVIVIEGMGHAASVGAAHQPGGAMMPEYTSAVAAFIASLK
jgi:alpha-beta hydrolase superfamily lysophospholipase